MAKRTLHADPDPVRSPDTAPRADDDSGELHRLCVFELDLTCGHRVTVRLYGWYPVWVQCCDRLGGQWVEGTFYPFASEVEYAACLEERYELRPPGSEREPLMLLDRRDRDDKPFGACGS